MKPNEVSEENDGKVWKALYSDARHAAKPKYKFKIGDSVRISIAAKVFRKGYLPKWSEEIFTIGRRIRNVRPLYVLKDYGGEELKGTFYEEELQKVLKDTFDTYRVEKVIRQRTIRGQKEYFVKWLGYPSSFNSWVTKLE